MEPAESVVNDAAAFKAAREAVLFRAEVEGLLPYVKSLIDDALGGSGIKTPEGVEFSELIKKHLLRHPFYARGLLDRGRKELTEKIGKLHIAEFKRNPAAVSSNQDFLRLSVKLGTVLGIIKLVESWENKDHLLPAEKNNP